jgi:CHAT domain-containing protein
MIVGHEVVSLPSASVLTLLRDQQAGRPRAAKALAIFADPVLDRRDSRVEGARGSAASTAAANNPPADRTAPIDDVFRSARDTGASFERLQYSRVEADTIAAMTPPGDALKALDFRASRDVAVSRELEQYRIVHFATHGLINSQRPELSGVVLSLVDEQGRAQDGFLRLHDIYNLKLAADLVVLSACQTALGREIRGEGLVGLTRGFMHAGSPRVVASLWEVRDRATAELMQRFYRGILTQGLRPAAALRAAQISMWKEPRWSAPFYWAGFVLQGDWR